MLFGTSPRQIMDPNLVGVLFGDGEVAGLLHDVVRWIRI